MRTLGIDLAAQPKKTAVAVIDWREDNTVAVEIPETDFDDPALLQAIADADAVGIDAPFGWPRFIVEHLPRYAAEGSWPPKPKGAGDDWLDRIRYRETDRFVRTWTENTLGFRLSPLSVSSDRIAYCAWRCAGLLHQHAKASRTHLDRLGASNSVFEVYPSAALAAWGLPYKGYKPGSAGSDKSKNAEACRHQIARELDDACDWLELDRVPELREALTSSVTADDKLDAFVSALVARAAATEPQLTIAPTNELQRELAREEGWIHLPQPDSLRQLVG
jgi:Protein of unknown function (DUF429)